MSVSPADFKPLAILNPASPNPIRPNLNCLLIRLVAAGCGPRSKAQCRQTPPSARMSCPVINSASSLARNAISVFEFVDVADAKLDQLRAQSVEVQTQLAGAKTFTSLQLFGSSFGAEPGDFGGGFPLHNHNTVSISNNEVSRAYDHPGANDWHIR